MLVTSINSKDHSQNIACVYVFMLSPFNRVLLFETLWTAARQAPVSRGFFRQEYWRGLPCPLPGDIPDPGTKPVSLTSPALAGKFFTTRATWEAHPMHRHQTLHFFMILS